MSALVTKARKLMWQQTRKNKAPVWELTELSAKKGFEVAKKYKANVELVVTALYLAHTVFSTKIGGSVQKNHTKLSSAFAKKYLNRWKVPQTKQAVILNAIEAHHDHIPVKSLEAEIVKNAEGFKFLSVEGALIFLHNLGKRGLTYSEAKKEVIRKMNQKFSYLTLSDCKREAKINCKQIIKLLSK